MENSFLSQEEIDALLGGKSEISESKEQTDTILLLSPEEQDVLREIGNINAGSATTALSELLTQRVLIDTPDLKLTTLEELQKGFNVPYLQVEVEYLSGLKGNNVFILKAKDAAVIANLMMGGDGKNCSSDMDEITVSAVSEAMNQMIGFSATSMSQIFQRTIEISPPKITLVNLENDQAPLNRDIFSENIAVISFNLTIGELLQSEIMLIMNIQVAKMQVGYLIAGAINNTFTSNEEKNSSDVSGPQHQIIAEDNISLINKNNLNLILDIPLKLSVLLGKTKQHIADVLKLTQGSIVELERLENEPVDILVNDILIARGEVVVVKEYFGVRITDIISTENRIKSLVSQ
jgi:flagellar motor switch protein FliN/FliY